ncbi:MAG: AMP-binding protein [Halobacteriota archaeon]|nr:AMP-binding protein [Halobacteriota archaeon]
MAMNLLQDMIGDLPKMMENLQKQLSKSPKMVDMLISSLSKRTMAEMLPMFLNAFISVSNKTFIVDGEERFTYKQYKDRAFRFANGLVDLGVGHGDNITLMLYNSNEFIEAIGAPFTIGARACLMNWHFQGEEIVDLLKDSKSKVLILDEEFIDRIADIRSELESVEHFIVVGKKAPDGMMLYEDFISNYPIEQPPAPFTLEEIGMPVMLYTGGSTGRPKGVQLEGGFTGVMKPSSETLDVGSGMSLLPALIEGFHFNETTNIHLVSGPLYHAAPFAFFGFTLILQGTLVLMRKFDPIEMLKLIEEEKISTAYLPPILLKRTLNIPLEERAKYDISSLKSLTCGAAPCPAELKKAVVDCFGPVFHEWYASTDAAFNTILMPEHYIADESKFASVGKIVSGNKIKILDENGSECPPGVPGDFYVKSIYTDMLSYYNDPEKTSNSFRTIDNEKYFVEGEVMYRDEEDFYYVVDRKKDMIISGGVNVYPAEIENVIHNHPKVRDVAVIGVPDPEWGESIKAFIQLMESDSATDEEIIAFCKEHLASYKKPKLIEFVSELPRHIDGKIMKQELRKKHWEGRDSTAY